MCCGLTLGSHVTLVGNPRTTHEENEPKIALLKEEDKLVMISQFIMELQGLKTVEGGGPTSSFEFQSKKKHVMVMCCGLTLGSHVTLVGNPRPTHEENKPKIALLKEEDKSVMISQFIAELQGLKTVEGGGPISSFEFQSKVERGLWETYD
ncbi:hydroxyproline O-galactosyltransferase GALT6-like [Fagus crenata]